jgi:hypothetical protein
VTAYTQRVRVGSYYTDGHRLAEVVRVYPLGHIQLRDSRTGEHIGCGIARFREDWWLAATPADEKESAA